MQSLVGWSALFVLVCIFVTLRIRAFLLRRAVLRILESGGATKIQIRDAFRRKYPRWYNWRSDYAIHCAIMRLERKGYVNWSYNPAIDESWFSCTEEYRNQVENERRDAILRLQSRLRQRSRLRRRDVGLRSEA